MRAQDEESELAKKLANPVASLISVPIQANYDEKIGPDEDGSVWRINIQPVVPLSLNEEWNLISRTILPVLDQSDVPVKGQGESGVGDVLQSLFLSPKAPGKDEWEAETWAVPVNLSASQLLKVGPQIFQVGVGVRYWAEAPENGPEDWGVRATLTLLFPK